jgi:hypothetical protein
MFVMCRDARVSKTALEEPAWNAGRAGFRTVLSTAFSLLIPLLAGCANLPASRVATPAVHVPAEAFMVHRVVLTARGKEYALTGYLALSQNRGMRLVVSDLFGQQLADVLLKPDGSVHVMKFSPLLRREWIEKYLAADLNCLFGEAKAGCPVTVLNPGHFLLQRRWYRLDLRIVETRPGSQPDPLFDETPEPKR